MKTLIVIRHAKSDWDAPFGDFERPLLQRGVRDANLVAQKAALGIPKNAVIWSSSAKRASQTARIFAAVFSHPESKIIFKQDLYTFDGSTLEKIIKSCDNAVDCLIVFGHNEAITDFVNKFGDIFIDNVTTSGFVTLTFETDEWKKIGNGKTSKIIFPRDLRP